MEILAIALSAIAIIISGLTARTTRRIGKKLSEPKEFHTDKRNLSPPAASLSAYVYRDKQNPALVIVNDGSGDAKNISMKLDGRAFFDHQFAAAEQDEIRQIGPKGKARYLLNPTSNARSATVEITWDDESGEGRTWNSQVPLH